MGMITTIRGLDSRGIEASVREEYFRNKEAWDAMVGLNGQPFRTVYDLLRSKERTLKSDQSAAIQKKRRILDDMRLAKFLEMVNEDIVEDVSPDELNAKCEILGA